MVELRQILCPTDLSPESDEALRYGVALTKAYGAKLNLIFCGEREVLAGATFSSKKPFDDKTIFESALAPHLGLNDFAKLNWEGIVAPRNGDVGEQIVKLAAERHADLIVMRSRRRPRGAALLGSTAERIYRTAPCPILVTHPNEREWVSMTTGEIALGRVLVAHDFSNDSELALRYAISLAQEYQAELHLLHVLARPEHDGPEVAWGPAGIEGAYNAAARRLQQSVTEEASLWSQITHTVRWGKPYQEVLSYATEHEIDLICMGARGKNFSMGALFGSNVDRVLRQAPCPVLVTRPLRPEVLLPDRNGHHNQ
jgi:nucleotide-binding universal stress UspA family protein